MHRVNVIATPRFSICATITLRSVSLSRLMWPWTNHPRLTPKTKNNSVFGVLGFPSTVCIYIWNGYICVCVYIYIYTGSAYLWERRRLSDSVDADENDDVGPLSLREEKTKQNEWKVSQTVYIQRAHEHTRTGNWSESSLGSLRGAPLNISRCLRGESYLKIPVWRSRVRAKNHQGGLTRATAAYSASGAPNRTS